MATKKLIRNLLAFSIAALVVALAVVIFRGRQDVAPVTADEPSPAKVDVALKQVRYTETHSGVKQWTLIADGVEYWRDKELSRLENIEMTFYRQDESGNAQLKARQGLYDLDRRELEIWGDVVLMTEDGMTFRTERAFYSQNSRQVSSKEKVSLSVEGANIVAVGMRYGLEGGVLELLSEVEAQIVSAQMPEKAQ